MCGADVPLWFLYVCEENGDSYYEPVRRMFEFRYNLLRALKGIRRWEDWKRVKREYQAFRRHRHCDHRPLVKDPFTLFSAEWFADNFNAEVIVIVRHPAAVVSSIRRLNWGCPLHHLMKQPLLMEGHLSSFASQIREYTTERHSTLEKTILLWNTIYSVVDDYRTKHQDWVFARHEDISRNPVSCFQGLFTRLGLHFSSEVESFVHEHSHPANPTETSVEQPYALKRNSRSALWNWKERLTESEIDLIRRRTVEVADRFYGRNEW